MRTEVFVTSHGSAYHLSDRHYLTGSGKAFISLRKAMAAGYVPCQRCFPGKRPQVVRAGRDGSRQFRAIWKEQRK